MKTQLGILCAKKFCRFKKLEYLCKVFQRGSNLYKIGIHYFFVLTESLHYEYKIKYK
jgi:hypothetical protein